MSFEEKDVTAPVSVETKPVQVRFERNEAHTEGPKVDIWKVLDVDGNSVHTQIDRDVIVNNWDGPEKTLTAWILAILAAV